MSATQAKFQVKTEIGTLLSWADHRTGINKFLDNHADGTPNADYLVMGEATADGITVITVRDLG